MYPRPRGNHNQNNQNQLEDRPPSAERHRPILNRRAASNSACGRLQPAAPARETFIAFHTEIQLKHCRNAIWETNIIGKQIKLIWACCKVLGPLEEVVTRWKKRRHKYVHANPCKMRKPPISRCRVGLSYPVPRSRSTSPHPQWPSIHRKCPSPLYINTYQ